jgi:hypothetical protein
VPAAASRWEPQSYLLGSYSVTFLIIMMLIFSIYWAPTVCWIFSKHTKI